MLPVGSAKQRFKEWFCFCRWQSVVNKNMESEILRTVCAALTAIVVFVRAVDSFGGLMYVQDHHGYIYSYAPPHVNVTTAECREDPLFCHELS